MKTDLWNGIPIKMTKHNKPKMINHKFKMILDEHVVTANSNVFTTVEIKWPEKMYK